MAWTDYSAKVTQKLADLGEDPYKEYYEDYANQGATYTPDASNRYAWIDSRRSKSRLAQRTYGDYSYDKQPTLDSWMQKADEYGPYTDRLQPLWDEQLNALLDREAYSYDPNNDANYQIYKDAYTSAGKDAMKNTLAQMSKRTGGLASSYAGAVAQQQYNKYMQDLANVIPQLEQIAYSRYQDAGNNMRSNLDMISNRGQQELGYWQAGLDYLNNRENAYMNDRNFDYGVYNDKYGRIMDTVNMYDNLYKEAMDEERDKRQNMYDAANMYLALSQNRNNQLLTEYEALGNREELERQRALEDLAAAAAASSGGSGGSGGGRSYSSGGYSGGSSGGSDYTESTPSDSYWVDENGYVWDSPEKKVLKYKYAPPSSSSTKKTTVKSGGGSMGNLSNTKTKQTR